MNTCPKCGQQYPMILTVLPNGTQIYDCTKKGCGHVWGERLVQFEVSFQLAEAAGNGHDGGNGQGETIESPSRSLTIQRGDQPAGEKLETLDAFVAVLA